MNKVEFINNKESVWLAVEGFVLLEFIISGIVFKWDRLLLFPFAVMTIVYLILAFCSLKKKEILFLSVIIHVAIIFLLFINSKGKILMIVSYYVGMMPTIIPSGLLFLRNTINEMFFIIFYKTAKNKEIRKTKRIITCLHMIAFLLSTIWISIVTVYLNEDKRIVLDDGIQFCQPLLDEYYELNLSTLQIENFYLTQITSYEDPVIMIDFKRLNDGDINEDKEKIIQCTNIFMNKISNSEYYEYDFYINFEKIERGGYDWIIKYKNGEYIIPE